MKNFLIPAIDLKDGKVVRLYKGEEENVKVYSHNPEDVAKRFEDFGFKRIHVVDLDGAFGSNLKNFEVIKNIRRVFSGILQVGGGLRSLQMLRNLDEEGVDLFVVGTVAVKSPEMFEEMLDSFPERIILSVDSKGGMVSVAGWKEGSSYTPEELAKLYDKKPIWGYLYTVVEKDGTLEGVDVEPYVKFKKFVNKPVLASGGVASIEDLKKLKGIVEGVVVGKALYEGRIKLEELE
ncbi:1-(5-phosphoribosyl)-5-[(5-phosphoribosylamino)methylideneamino]imidazole-4-carboxamide isomerase [Thermocrinis sp.]